MKARIGGTDLSYDVCGQGPPVLFLHAFPLSMALWDDQVRSLSPHFTVVRFDCRGFGATPTGDGLLTMERIADDAAALLDHLRLDRVVLCGISMGGYAAFASVRRHVSRLRGLVLCDTRAGADTAEGRVNRDRQRELVRQQGSGAVADLFLPKLVGKTTHETRPAVVARLREMMSAAPARGVTDALAGLAARADSTVTLREIRVPTLLVFGAEDAITPPSEGEALQRGIAGSRLVVIPGAGHLANIEAPEAFDAAVRPFLESIGV